MQRHAHIELSPIEAEWTFVSEKRPCTICGGHEGCRKGFEGQFVCCMRVSSERPLVIGGWLHRMELQAEVITRAAPALPRSATARGVEAGAPGGLVS